jgi:hypothetical protein
MNNEAFIHGFMDEMEKAGVAPLLGLAARALPAIGKVVSRVGPKLLSAGKSIGGRAMSLGSKGGNIGKAVNVASNLGGMAEIIRARNPKQPANAGNTITTPQ